MQSCPVTPSIPITLQCLEAPALQLRQADEVRQLCRALALVLEEMVRLAPALQQEEKAAKEALTAAAAAGDAAAAAQAKASHGNLSSHYVNTLRDRLLAAGLEGKLPRACSKVRQQGHRAHAGAPRCGPAVNLQLLLSYCHACAAAELGDC